MYSPDDRFTVTTAGLAALASAPRAGDDCDCERDDDGMPMMCRACRDALAVELDDDREEGDPRDGCAPSGSCYDDAPF